MIAKKNLAAGPLPKRRPRPASRRGSEPEAPEIDAGARSEGQMRAVQVALQVIEVIGRKQPIGVSEVARRLALPKSTVQRSLRALETSQWIESTPDERGGWTLTLKAGLSVGGADYAVRRLRVAAIPVMEELRRRTHESIYLAVRHDMSIALVERLDGINPVSHAWPLWRGGPMHATSLGKAILGAFSDDQLNAYLAGPLAKVSARTVTDPATLKREMKAIRKRGFATTFQTNWPDENGVGAAIRDERGEPFAAVSISAPMERVNEAKCLELGALLVDAARRISLGLARR
jgi:IclR family acetate operon transcriptional repressor